MSNMNTQLLNLLLLLVFSCFSCFLVLVPVSAKVFLSIDCGSSSLKPRTDENSIVWVGDGPYIQTGNIHQVNGSTEPKFDSNVMSTLRAFPTRKKNCYSIDIDNKAEEDNTMVDRVLVRANFYYGNYDNKSSPPTFNLQFNGNNWKQNNNTENSIVYEEVVFSLKKGNNIDVCLAQTQPDNIPFISALEVRSLDSDAYSYVPSDYPSFFVDRVAYGTNTTIRYPEDSYDRIWDSYGPLSNTSPLMRVRSTSPSINVNIEDKPPEAVLRTTLTSSKDLLYSRTRNLTVPLIHLNAYFSEVIKLNSTQKRSFDIIVNNNLDNSIILPKNPVIPPYGRALEVHILNVTTFNSSFSILFNRTNDSTLAPLINAIEEFIIGEKLAQGTNSKDVGALGLLQKSFIQLQDWNGDPCLPSPYTWDWVACNDDTDSPRITALYLNDLGLKGRLPDFSAMNALKTINLGNNTPS
ncbi:LRR receptor-like serine/threonine-protein kinase IOS1 isoform X1 [Papaver somniferum]|uniref:LRR receptor-like serine/threonine-protein kinase IOS1 isoform X1 n=1 Tax=Papaver somniferum TaxID=3469 RepID=UPI000E6F6F45|nr:LRR receptor-like serine/threonine-protein kinase IOS1 isoform X1 [Papaver somniferum]XP_026389066.1 LRR receptor-like serine/threonine-protein kinase IOS1 isoform X1 [Papaver somniferum]XP_026389067.1 LRR receptor-like serine/threonine-protein kinase IOS1 isoform X1 [Papaver somniferum]XP_026389068.1 LRR receptor-like serine/threonine-protein kinase IOS1 isoform X1 [Papaver somniferum]XP_026389069.1 LRR receptor-like serine/threonine-protein kinase IOS1 isoform X1 [Papaver somniferum]